MSHIQAQAIRRAALRLGAALVLAAPLAGCFQPVYAPTAAVDRRAVLQAIKVEPVQGRYGFYMTEELRFLLNGTGETVTPKYRLLISFSNFAGTPLIDTVSGRASSNSLYTRAEYTLMPIGAVSTTTPIAQGFVFSHVEYDRISNRFANVRAARDAEIRNAKALAEQIRSRLTTEISDKI